MRDLRDNLAELLITHHVGGRWRAPLSQRLRRPCNSAGRPIGCLVEAGAADLARALAAARSFAPAEGAATAERFVGTLAARAAALAEARRIEGLPEATAPTLATWPEAEAALASLPPGPVVLLGRVDAAPGRLAALLAAGLRQGRPMILKPAPRAPITPLVLIEALQAAGTPPGAVALLQGGGIATGAPLLAHPRVAGALLPQRGAPRPGIGPPDRPPLTLPA